MRTNTLLLTVALGVASAATSMAQVYSVNSVGYINIPVKLGFNLIANQLVQANQTIGVLLAGSPDQATVYKFAPGPGGGYSIIVNDIGGEGDWVGGDGPATTFDNGGGLFLLSPSDYTVTLVGEVAQGSLITPLVSGFQIVSSRVPQAGLISTDLGFVGQDADTVYQYVNTGNPASSGYQIYVNDLAGEGDWTPSQPAVAVGEAVFLLSNGAHTPSTWSRTFTVN